ADASSTTTLELFAEIQKELDITLDSPVSSDPFAAANSAWSSVETPSIETASVETGSGETPLGEVPSAVAQQEESKAEGLEAGPPRRLGRGTGRSGCRPAAGPPRGAGGRKQTHRGKAGAGPPPVVSRVARPAACRKIEARRSSTAVGVGMARGSAIGDGAGD